MLGAHAGPLGAAAPPGDAAPAAGEHGQKSGGSSEFGRPSCSMNPGGAGALGESERGGRGGGGNRWPRQETVALLKIRAEMDGAFRDASLKGPLWEEVSRKMAAVGFRRSAKKCKEKFENVYKYHKRTKDGRAFKADGKSYCFFDQLEAFESHMDHSLPPSCPVMVAAPTPPPPSAANPTPLTIIPPIPNNNPFVALNPSPPFRTLASSPVDSALPPSSSTSSGEDMQSKRLHRRPGEGGLRRREWEGYLEGLVREVVRKQEEMQNQFLEALERHEREREARDQAWRDREAARVARELELLAQQRSAAAAKDKVVLMLLQKATRMHNLQFPIVSGDHGVTAPENVKLQPPAKERALFRPPEDIMLMQEAISSRWPKAEVQALIKLRTGLEVKYQESGPKGPLWEEISAAMAEIGYRRSAKRCKEKWENINKYYKKVKESSGKRRRREDSKTCPYFHQLEVIYKEKSIAAHGGEVNSHVRQYLGGGVVPPIMARPEQQWPLFQQQHQRVLGDELDRTHKQGGEDDDEDDDDEDVGAAHEVMASKPPHHQPPPSLAE